MEGGTHVAAFREGLLRGINAFSGRSFAADDLRDGLTGLVGIRLQNPKFDSQTKLGTPKKKKPVYWKQRWAIRRRIRLTDKTGFGE